MEEKIVTSNLKGGLGNVMFQIAAAYAYGMEYNKNPIFSFKNFWGSHKNIREYINNIFKNVKFIEDNLKVEKIYQEPSFDYHPIPQFDGSLKIDGYFQSEKYFLKYRDKIIELFLNNQEKEIEKVMNRYNIDQFDQTCSIHVRRGDYLNLSHIHPPQNMNYFMKATKKVSKNCVFFIMSDDIEWCKENFPNIKDKFIFVEGQEDYQDLLLMTLCDNNIISNSTFSWWGAWLNNNQYKNVVVPQYWFGEGKKDTSAKDVIPENWIKI